MKIRFRFLVISCQSSEMAAWMTFPKKDGRICALVPQKARAWAVTSLEININSCWWRKILYISCMKDSSSSEAWWEWLAAHYDQDQKEPFLIMKKVLITCKLETRNYKPTATCIDWFNIGPTSTATLNRLEILINKVCCFLL